MLSFDKIESALFAEPSTNTGGVHIENSIRMVSAENKRLLTQTSRLISGKSDSRLGLRSGLNAFQYE
jgi:hypothetical protein